MADLRRGRNRRFGLFLQTNLASVPAWAPIGLDASRYIEYLTDPDLSVEVQAHHRSRWDHVQRPEDFLPLLHFELFDPEQWVDLAIAGGMSHIVQVAKDAQGVCWWDAPAALLDVIAQGPRRDVAGAVAKACAQAGLDYGSAYSYEPNDLGEVPPADLKNLHDLVERLGSSYLWGQPSTASHSPHLAEVSTTGTLTHLRDLHHDLLLNDLWGLPQPDRTTRNSVPPAQSDTVGWELIRGLGSGRGHNRVETAQHQMSPIQIVALLTEVLAKGGNLLLAVGSGADGRIPAQTELVLRAAGTWINAHHELINDSEPWDTWGSDTVRYLRSTKAPDTDGEVVWAIDLAGRGELAAFGHAAGVVTEVTVSREPELSTGEVTWAQETDGLRVVHTDRAGVSTLSRARRHAADPSGIGVYRVKLRPHERVTLSPADSDLVTTALFDTAPFDTTAAVIEMADLLREVEPGSVLQLGEATYRASDPLPHGITLRGLGADRTKIQVDPAHPLNAGTGTRIEFAEIHSATSTTGPLLRITGSNAVLLGVRVAGRIDIAGNDHMVRGSELRTVNAAAVDRLTVSRCQISDPVSADGSASAGIEIHGGSHHLIESCEISGHHTAISCSETDHLTIRGNSILGGQRGIRVHHCEAPHVVGNSMRSSTRAVDIEGGSGAIIDANAVADGDSGCVVHNGATAVVVSGNHWQHCRIGLLLWSAGEVVHHSNVVVNLLEPEHALMTGP